MLHRGSTAEELAEYLGHVVTEELGLSSVPDRERALADKLVVWWKNQ
jgi:hypothetical protein